MRAACPIVVRPRYQMQLHELALTLPQRCFCLLNKHLSKFKSNRTVATYLSGAHVSWRLTHWKDPVPHLPLEGMGFRHISTEVFYTQDSKNFTICQCNITHPTNHTPMFDRTLLLCAHLVCVCARARQLQLAASKVATVARNFVLTRFVRSFC